MTLYMVRGWDKRYGAAYSQYAATPEEAVAVATYYVRVCHCTQVQITYATPGQLPRLLMHS